MSEANGKVRESAQLKRTQTAFLAAFSETGNITHAAVASDVGRRTHYEWLENDQVYAAAFVEAGDTAADYLEAEARRRAEEGVRRLKFYKGEPVINPETGKQYFEHEFSDTLLIFLLKGRRPDIFSERYKHEVTGKDGGPLKYEDANDARDRFRNRIAGVMERGGSGSVPVVAPAGRNGDGAV